MAAMAAATTTVPGSAQAPRAFGEARALTVEQLRGAPIRYPRPSRLDLPLRAPGARAARALQMMGLSSVGALLEHLPRDRREARAIADLELQEGATIIAEVRAIAARPVRRRGMRPLVEAKVADATGSVRATFFNQPWLAERYPPGTRLILHGKLGRRGDFAVQSHAPTRLAAAGEEAVAHYPVSEGITSTQLLA